MKENIKVVFKVRLTSGAWILSTPWLNASLRGEICMHDEMQDAEPTIGPLEVTASFSLFLSVKCCSLQFKNNPTFSEKRSLSFCKCSKSFSNSKYHFLTLNIHVHTDGASYFNTDLGPGSKMCGCPQWSQEGPLPWCRGPEGSLELAGHGSLAGVLADSSPCLPISLQSGLWYLAFFSRGQWDRGPVVCG